MPSARTSSRWECRPLAPSSAERSGSKYQAGVDRLLDALHRKGWIQILPSVDRGIRLLREGAPILDAEQLPAVATGNPIVAYDQPEPARLHDFDSLVDQLGIKPEWFVRVAGSSLEKVGFRSRGCPRRQAQPARGGPSERRHRRRPHRRGGRRQKILAEGRRHDRTPLREPRPRTQDDPDRCEHRRLRDRGHRGRGNRGDEARKRRVACPALAPPARMEY